MSTRHAANCFWTPLSIDSDQDLVGAARVCAVPIAERLKWPPLNIRIP
jgi:hypothetical protein